MGSVSGLMQVPDLEQLHQPHQERYTDAPGDKFSVELDIPDFAFGRSNRIYLPPLELVASSAKIRVRVSYAAGSPAVTNPKFVPTPAWIGSQGIQILYKAQGLYNFSEFEACVWPYFNTENTQNLMTLCDAQNDVAAATAQGRVTNDAAVYYDYYIDLGPLIPKILSNYGALSAHAANSWSFDINLKAANKLISASASATNGSAYGAPTLNILEAVLVLTGHREDAENAQMQSNYLSSMGIRAIFTQSNYIRNAVAASASSTTVSLADQEGDVSDIVIGRRNADSWDQTTTGQELGTPNPSTVDPMNWIALDNVGDLLSVGTTSNPTRVFGRALCEREVRLVIQGTDCLTGRSKYLQGDGTYEDNYVMWIPLGERASMGQIYGTYSGTIRIKNNFRLLAQYASTVVRQYMDTLVYIRRGCVLKHEGMSMMNVEG
jgi:hypothetical protein